MKSLSYVCSGLFCKPILCFVLSCGIRVASKSNVDSIPSRNGVLILRCEYQSFLIIKIVLPILFNRCISLQVDPIISISARSSISSSQRCCLHPFQVDFVFPTLPPFFFKDSDFLIKYPFYSCEFYPFLFVNVLTRWFSCRCSTSSIFSILFFSGGFNSNFADHIFFLVSNVFSCRCTS